MVIKKYASPSLAPGTLCVFTNRGSSGYTGNDGKECVTRQVKPREIWYSSEEPEYVIDLPDGPSFGARESELVAVLPRLPKEIYK